MTVHGRMRGLVATCTVLCIWLCATRAQGMDTRYTDHVDIFTGTYETEKGDSFSYGNVQPYVTMPFGFNHWQPQTRWRSCGTYYIHYIYIYIIYIYMCVCVCVCVCVCFNFICTRALKEHKTNMDTYMVDHLETAVRTWCGMQIVSERGWLPHVL